MARNKVSFALDGIDQIKRAMELIGPEVARQAGKTGNRRAMVYLRQQLRAAAPVNPKGPTKKYWRTKNGDQRSGFYGRLRTNIRYVAGRKSTRHENSFYGVVGVGDAFWGGILERGQGHLAGNPREGWFSDVISRSAAEALRIQAKSVGEAIPQACRKYRNRKKRVRR